MSSLRSSILGTGLGVPGKVLTNDDLAKFVDTSDEWIRTRTGISQRYVVDREKGESLTSIMSAAANEALINSNTKAEEIELVICCTATPDTIMPITGGRVAAAIGASKAAAYDLNAACSGFLFGLHTADAFVRSGIHKKVLVIGGEVMTSALNWEDRNTCVLFGDGAGAVVVGPASRESSHIIASKIYSQSDIEERLCIQVGGSRIPAHKMKPEEISKAYLQMDGKEIFRIGSKAMAQAALELLAETGISGEEVDWLVPHQANVRIIEKVAEISNIPMSKVFVNLDRWGNTSAGTLPICLAEMEKKGLLKKGQLILLDAFGGGFTWGSMLIRW